MKRKIFFSKRISILIILPVVSFEVDMTLREEGSVCQLYLVLGIRREAFNAESIWPKGTEIFGTFNGFTSPHRGHEAFNGTILRGFEQNSCSCVRDSTNNGPQEQLGCISLWNVSGLGLARGHEIRSQKIRGRTRFSVVFLLSPATY